MRWSGSPGKPPTRKGGEFYTPAEVVRLLVQLVKPQAGNEIYDPTVGSGGFLIQSRQYVEEQGQNANNLALYGQDSNGHGAHGQSTQTAHARSQRNWYP